MADDKKVRPIATASVTTPEMPLKPNGAFWKELQDAKGDLDALNALDETVERFGYVKTGQLRQAILTAKADIASTSAKKTAKKKSARRAR